jgi:hypothetical protein
MKSATIDLERAGPRSDSGCRPRRWRSTVR